MWQTWLTTDIKEYNWIKVQHWCSNLVTEDVSVWLEQIWFDFDFQLWANHWFSTGGQFTNFIWPEFNFFLFWSRLKFTFSLSKSFQKIQMLVFTFIPFSPSASWTSRKGAGPQIRMVPSSEALASKPGTTGFQLTQLTVRVWPVSSAMGSSLRRCQM